MFLPFVGFEGASFTWWESFNGLDVALLVACILATALALAALTGRDPIVWQLSGVAGGIVFGLAFTPIPSAIASSKGARAGLWMVAATGAIALAGAIVDAFRAAPRQR
jgi:hypothetical protein